MLWALVPAKLGPAVKSRLGAASTSHSIARSFTGSEALPLPALAQRALRVLVEQHRARLGHLYPDEL